jgi:MFS superfamily sulfate permease-like transporter
MCFSFAIIAQVDPLSGLYAFIIHPLVYAFLGSCPQMIVGPEATGSLLVGSVVRQLQSAAGSDEEYVNAEISGVITAMAGLILLVAGISRIGFVDSMLNRPFMQGFISGVGFVLVIEQAIPELGLKELARETGYSRSSAMLKVYFIITNMKKAHLLTAIVAFSTLAFILVFRATQRAMRSKYPGIALVPDRLLAIFVTTVLCWKLRLDQRGLEILGALGTSGPKLPQFYWPFDKFATIELVFTTSFLSALLGFFESSVTARSIRPEKSVLSTSLSANRELIALGTANILGGCFTTLPAFGGFGRSKLNVQAGGTTPMASVLLTVITLLCVFFILPGLYFVPKAVLSAMASAVGISMMEECPHDLRFFFKVRGWQELTLMALVFLATACYSMSLGIAVGILFTLFTLVRHSTKSRIQILGRIPGTKHVFEDAELAPEGDQFDQCLIVRIAEPLTFANSGDLRTRLRRLEWYGTHDAHPSLPRVRAEDEILIFDGQGLTAIDACATQVLTEIVQEWTRNGAQVIFCRLKQTQVLDSFRRSGIVGIVGGLDYFVEDVEAALHLAGVVD